MLADNSKQESENYDHVNTFSAEEQSIPCNDNSEQGRTQDENDWDLAHIQVSSIVNGCDLSTTSDVREQVVSSKENNMLPRNKHTQLLTNNKYCMSTSSEMSTNIDSCVLYCCLTCSVKNLSLQSLSAHENCVVTVQKLPKNHDHIYMKRKPNVMNYLLTQAGTSIHVKCFQGNENQIKLFSCSACTREEQLPMSEACNHVQLLKTSLVLDNLQNVKPSSMASRPHPDTKRAHYMCVTCGKLYKRKLSLVMHLKTHSSEPATCLHCSKVFMSEAMLNAHLNVHGVFPYQCLDCEKTFLLKPLLSRHIAREHTLMPWDRGLELKRLRATNPESECNSGDKTVPSSGKKMEVTDESILCPWCGRSFPTSSAMRSHEKYHNKESSEYADRSIVCDMCGILIADRRTLKKHILRQHNDRDTKSFVCEVCGLSFWEMSKLSLHQTIHSEKRPFTCHLCDATFKRKNYLSNHMEHLHNERLGTVVDPCERCGEKFKSKGAKLEHLKTHSIRRLYSCNICNKNSLTKIGLFLHTKYAHEKNSSHTSRAARSILRRAQREKPNTGEGSVYSCNLCVKVYSSKAGLYQHKRNVHLDGSREYHCDVCGKVYLKAVSFYAHKAMHARQEFKCTVCSKVFRLRATYNQHMVIHSNVKKHQCTQCDKSFHRKAYLRIHIRTHTGEKPYHCEICGRAFNQGNDMKRHRARHFQSGLAVKILKN